MLCWKYLTFSVVLVYFTRANRAPRSKRTIIGYYPLCPRGCASCSAINGCVTCRPKLFMLLHRNGMRQTGICTHICPAGYYGLRRRNFSKCYKCRVNHCDACFSRSYCTRCRPPYMAHRGKCIEQCPGGLYYANYSKECKHRVDCGVTQWGGWGACSRKGQTCGFKYGMETRTRQTLQLPSVNGRRCPAITESRRCRMRMRKCVDILHNNSDPTRKGYHRGGRRGRGKKKRRWKIRRRRRQRRRNNKNNKKRGRRRRNRHKRPLAPDVTTNQISALVLPHPQKNDS